VVAVEQRLPESRVHIHVEPWAYPCPDTYKEGCSVAIGERHRSEEE
jgi:hypothetical protein